MLALRAQKQIFKEITSQIEEKNFNVKIEKRIENKSKKEKFQKETQNKMDNSQEFLRKELANKYNDMEKKVDGFE